jgi:hypothetical protein
VRDGKFGYIDHNGKIVILARFDRAEKFSEGLAIIQIDGKYGYINTDGKIVIPPLGFEFIYPFKNGLAATTINNNNSLHYIDQMNLSALLQQFFAFFIFF